MEGEVEKKQKWNKNSSQILIDFAEPLCQTILKLLLL